MLFRSGGAEVVVSHGIFWGRGIDKLLGPGRGAGEEQQEKKGWGVQVFHMIGIDQECPKILSIFVKKNRGDWDTVKWVLCLNFVRKRAQYGKDHRIGSYVPGWVYGRSERADQLDQDG